MEFSFLVDQIPSTGEKRSDELTREWVQFALGDRLRPTADETPIEFELTRHDKNVLLDGGLTLHYAYDCSRCAETATATIDVPLAIAFVEGDEDAEDLSFNVEGLDARHEVVFYQGGSVDAETAVIEQIVFVLPSVPYCRQDCRGLCVDCGTNLNHTTCDCKVIAPVDNRWAALADIKLGG